MGKNSKTLAHGGRICIVTIIWNESEREQPLGEKVQTIPWQEFEKWYVGLFTNLKGNDDSDGQESAGRNSGTMIVDITCALSNIQYPSMFLCSTRPEKTPKHFWTSSASEDKEQSRDKLLLGLTDTSVGEGDFQSIYESEELSHRYKVVYLYLKDRSDASGSCWPAINTIASNLGLFRSTVKRAIHDLIQMEYLSKAEKYRSNGSHTSNRYCAS